MAEQLNLFENLNRTQTLPILNELQKRRIHDRFRGALIFSSAGDALGWPTEFGRYPDSFKYNRNDKYPLREYVDWQKRLGGRWWGYTDKIRAGSYSDDTQLGLCIARCIDSQGSFDAEKFSYFEMPLWLLYEQGGGSSVKFAARSFVSSKREWWRNFYIRKSVDIPLDYRNAGANGAAMRVLPLALVNSFTESKLFYEAFINAIVTHGHPRAILSTLIYAGAIGFLVQREKYTANEFLDYISYVVQSSTAAIQDWPLLDSWLNEWNKRAGEKQAFQEIYQLIRVEAQNYLDAISEHVSLDTVAYYKYIGALTKNFKGSGITTVLAAIYLFIKFHDRPQEALYTAVNTLGSDTDTIANFVGGLFGAYYGMSAVPEPLIDGLQDHQYLLDTALQLFNITSGEALKSQVAVERFSRKDALLRILAWEIGLHDMFWEALEEGDRLTHPSLGAGIITRKEIKPLARDDYEVKLVGVAFECGQTCTFHSRVSKNGDVDESLADDLKQGLAEDI